MTVEATDINNVTTVEATDIKLGDLKHLNAKINQIIPGVILLRKLL